MFGCKLLVMSPRSSFLSRAGLILNASYVNLINVCANNLDAEVFACVGSHLCCEVKYFWSQ